MDPSDIEILRRPDGSEWVLGEGRLGKVYKALKGGVQVVAVKKLQLQHMSKDTEELVKQAGGGFFVCLFVYNREGGPRPERLRFPGRYACLRSQACGWRRRQGRGVWKGEGKVGGGRRRQGEADGKGERCGCM